MYVIQRADGKFYCKHESISSFYGYDMFDNFDKAFLFLSEKGAKSRISYGSEGQDCTVKRVKVTLVD